MGQSESSQSSNAGLHLNNTCMSHLSGGPSVNGYAVWSGLDTYLGVEHDLRCPVPAGGHVLREEPGVIVVGVGHSSQTKVTDLGRDDVDKRDIE